MNEPKQGKTIQEQEEWEKDFSHHDDEEDDLDPEMDEDEDGKDGDWI